MLEKDTERILDEGEIAGCMFDADDGTLTYIIRNGDLEHTNVVYSVMSGKPTSAGGSDLSGRDVQAADQLVRKTRMQKNCIEEIAEAEAWRRSRGVVSVSLSEEVLDGCPMSMLTPSRRGDAVIISDSLPGACEISDGLYELLPYSDRLPHLSDPQYTHHTASLKREKGGYAIRVIGYAGSSSVCQAHISIPADGRYSEKLKKMLEICEIENRKGDKKYGE